MLPTPPCFSLQQIRGPWLQIERKGFASPFYVGIAPQSHTARTAKGNTRNNFEIRDVAMPAERSSCLVFRDERMREQRRGNTRPRRDPLAQRVQKGWNGAGRDQFVTRKVVCSAVTYDPASSCELFVFRFFQRELNDLIKEFGFFL